MNETGTRVASGGTGLLHGLLATLGRKLTAIFVGIAVVVIVVSVVSYTSVSQLVDHVDSVSHTYTVLDRIDGVGASLTNAETGQRGYIITGEDSYLEPYNQAVSDLSQEQQDLRTLTKDNASQQQRLDTLAPLVTAKLTELKNTIDLRRGQGFEAALKVVQTNQGKAVMDQARAVLTAMTDEENGLLARRQAEARDSANTTHLTIVIGLIALLAWMIIQAEEMTRRTSRRVRRVTDGIQSLAAGDLTHSVGLAGSDEFGTMGRHLDAATATVRSTIAQLADTAGALGAAATQLSAVSGKLNGSAQEASVRAAGAVTAADQVSQGIQTVSAGAEQMSASIREIAASAAQAAQVTTESLEIASATNQQITELSGASSEIGDVVKLITTIAEQTNLLALNATIEAARAGDAGKGFAVVAAEVKELAQQTAQATGDITARIHALQSSSGNAATAVERIHEVIEQISQYTTTIASSVEEQSATTNEMTRAISDAARSSGDVSESFGAVAEVSSATSDSAHASQQAAEDLSRLASRLNSLVQMFQH